MVGLNLVSLPRINCLTSLEIFEFTIGMLHVHSIPQYPEQKIN